MSRTRRPHPGNLPEIPGLMVAPSGTRAPKECIDNRCKWIEYHHLRLQDVPFGSDTSPSRP
jgi:hypothetical protein